MLKKATPFLVFILLFSCEKENFQPLQNQNRLQDQQNADHLRKRVDIINDTSSIKGKTGALSFILRSHIAPPTGFNVSGATSVHLFGNHIYVSHNKSGDDYGGLIDVIDISNPSNMRLVQQLSFNDADIHEMYVDNQYLYYCGQRNVESSGYYSHPGHYGAIAGKIKRKNGVLNIYPKIEEQPFFGFAINSITKFHNKLHMISGHKKGGIIVTDTNFVRSADPMDSLSIDGAHFLTREGSKFAALIDSKNGGSKLLTYNYSTTKPANASEIKGLPSAGGLERNGMRIIDDYLYVALNNNGLHRVDLNTKSSMRFSLHNGVNGTGDIMKSIDTYFAPREIGLVLYDMAGSSPNRIGEYSTVNLSYSFREIFDVVIQGKWIVLSDDSGNILLMEKL